MEEGTFPPPPRRLPSVCPIPRRCNWLGTWAMMLFTGHGVLTRKIVMRLRHNHTLSPSVELPFTATGDSSPHFHPSTKG